MTDCESPGTKGRRADIQSPLAPADRVPLPYGRIPVLQAGRTVQRSERVSLRSPPIRMELNLPISRYDNPDIALSTGMILREMLRDEVLAKHLLYSERLYDFIDYIDKTSFGIACDAQATFKVTLSESLVRWELM